MTLYRLSDIVDFEKGASATLKTEPGEYPLVVTAKDRKTSSNYQFDGDAVCVPLVSSTGHGNAAIHRVHYQKGKFALANLLVALIPKGENRCHTKFLYYLLQARKDSLLVPLMQGTANVSLKIKDLHNVEVTLPSYDEQVKIANALDYAVAIHAEAEVTHKAVITESGAIPVAMSHRYDLSIEDKLQQGWKKVSLGEVLSQRVDSINVETGKVYPHFGIYSFAKGLFHKQPVNGDEIKSSKLYRVHARQFIYARLNAYEGAIGVISNEFDEHYVSNEFPTFDCDNSRLLPEFLEAYFRSPKVWEDLKRQVTGIGGGAGNRRIRLKESVFLSHQIWIPPLSYQEKVREVLNELNAMKKKQGLIGKELQAIIPAILNKAFRRTLL